MITNRQLCSCRNRYKCSRSLWPAKGIYLQWMHPKRRWISGKKYLTSSQGWSTLTGAQWSIIHPTNLSSFRSRSDSGTGLTGLIWSQILCLGVPPTSHLPPFSSMPFHGSSQVPLNRTFDVSGIPVTNIGNAQDAATIAAEVSAAAVAQASKEFWRMREPKITKLCMVGILLMWSSFSGPGKWMC